MANPFRWLIDAEHTFASWAEKELAKLHNAQPAIEQIALTTLKYAGPVVQMLVAKEAGAGAGDATGKVLAEVQSTITAASGFIYDYGAQPSAASLIDSAAANLSGLLAAGHIKNADSVSTANKVVAELQALTHAFAPPPPA